jgi:AcrR family transcriptional regulator
MVKAQKRSKSFTSNREGILKVATELFGSRGFDGTSVRNIAGKAGLSVAGMFHYFSSKEEILNEIMLGFMDDAYKELMEIYNADGDPREKLSEVCKFYVERYAGHKNELTILNSEGKSLLPCHRKVFIDKQRAYVEALKNLFNDLAKRKQLKPVNPSILAFIFFGMVHWTYSWYSPKAKRGIGPNRLGNIFSEIFLRGVLAE